MKNIWNNGRLDNYNEKQKTVLIICSMLSVFTAIVSNIFAVRSVNFWGMQETAALLMFPFCYILQDILGEFVAIKKIVLLTFITYAVQLCIYGLAAVTIALPVVAGTEVLAESFANVMGFVPRVVLASFCAYVAGSTINATVLRIMPDSVSFRIRAWVSTIFGELADTYVFLAVIGLSIEWKNVVMVAACKVGMETLLLPFTGIIVNKIKNM